MPALNFDEHLTGWVQEEFRSLVAQINAVFFREHNQDGTHAVGIGGGSGGGVPVGAFFPMAGPNVPAGYLKCDGTAIDRVTYKRLFEQISTTYGTGDGSTTFNLPNMLGRFALGQAASGTGEVLGETGGELDHTHTTGSHTHSLSGTTGSAGDHSHGGVTDGGGGHSHAMDTASTSGPSGSVEVQSGSGSDAASTGHTHGQQGTTGAVGNHQHNIAGSGAHDHTFSGTTGSASGGTSGSANPPYLAAPYIIFTGVFT